MCAGILCHLDILLYDYRGVLFGHSKRDVPWTPLFFILEFLFHHFFHIQWVVREHVNEFGVQKTFFMIIKW